MFNLMKLFWLFALAAPLVMPITVLARPLTPRDLVMLAHVETPAVSPDGTWLVWDQRENDLTANQARHDLWRLNLARAGARPERLAAVTSTNAHLPAFGTNGRLYLLSNLQDGKAALWSLDMTGGAPVQVTGDYDLSGFKLSPRGDAVAVWADQPVGARSLDHAGPPQSKEGSARVYDHLFVRHWDTWVNGERSQLFVIPIVGEHAPGGGHSVEGSLIGDTPSKPKGGVEEVAWSIDGRMLYFVLREAGQNEALSTNFDIFSAPADGSAPPTNLTANNPAIDTLPAVSPDGCCLAWAATSRAGYESDRKTVMVHNLATGKVRNLTAGWDRSVDSIAWANDSASLYVTAADVLDHPVFQVNLASGRVDRVTGEGSASEVMPLPRGGLIYILDTSTAPADLWRRDASGVSSRLTAVNAERLAGIDWPTTTRFSFRGAHGDAVWGLVMRPAEVPSSGGKFPVAFLVHGGPQGSASDAWSYRLNRVVWAGRGYASVSIDFHGSIGYGQAFTDSINNDWGGKPLVDLKLGLKAATDRFAFLDAHNVCGIGGSYGGYMMNWIEGSWPDRFKCLVQADGIFDVRAMAYETDELWADRWDRGGHLYYEAPADYEKSNPVNLVARWRTPQLVLTGERDFRSPDTQAIAAFTALQLRGIPSRLVVFPDENHQVQKPRNSVRWYDEVLNWMDEWTH
jgi:dipeptidyl aminopeptidase/acylaminoacyl peptidase